MKKDEDSAGLAAGLTMPDVAERLPASGYLCRRCGADPRPSGFYDPRRCAFDDAGNFTPDNWNCATIDAILGNNPVIVPGSDEHCEITPTYIDDGESDEHGGWIVTTRYKRRGCTSSAIYVGDFHPPMPLTLELAERVIASRTSYEAWRREQVGSVTDSLSEASTDTAQERERS